MTSLIISQHIFADLLFFNFFFFVVDYICRCKVLRNFGLIRIIFVARYPEVINNVVLDTSYSLYHWRCFGAFFPFFAYKKFYLQTEKCQNGWVWMATWWPKTMVYTHGYVKTMLIRCRFNLYVWDRVKIELLMRF